MPGIFIISRKISKNLILRQLFFSLSLSSQMKRSLDNSQYEIRCRCYILIMIESIVEDFIHITNTNLYITCYFIHSHMSFQENHVLHLFT